MLKVRLGGGDTVYQIHHLTKSPFFKGEKPSSARGGILETHLSLALSSQEREHHVSNYLRDTPSPYGMSNIVAQGGEGTNHT